MISTIVPCQNLTKAIKFEAVGAPLKLALLLVVTLATSVPESASANTVKPQLGNSKSPSLRGRTYLSLQGQIGPKSAANAPVLKTITAKYDVPNGNGRWDVMPEFHFVAPKGNAVMLHRELVETDSALTSENIRGARITVPNAQQMAGAVITGGWVCGPGRYHVTLQAWLEDAMGNRGNTLKYTIHCNELLMY